MFGIGMGEIILMLLIAFIVVGPKDLPKIARGLAKAIKYIKKNVQEVYSVLNLEEELAELQDAGATLREVMAEANPIRLLEPEVKDVQETVKQATAGVDPLKDLEKEIVQAKKATEESLQPSEQATVKS